MVEAVSGNRRRSCNGRRDTVFAATATGDAPKLLDALARRVPLGNGAEEAALALRHWQRMSRAQDRPPDVPTFAAKPAPEQIVVVDQVEDVDSGHHGHAAVSA